MYACVCTLMNKLIYKWNYYFLYAEMCQNVQYTTALNMKSCDYNIAHYCCYMSTISLNTYKNELCTVCKTQYSVSSMLVFYSIQNNALVLACG